MKKRGHPGLKIALACIGTLSVSFLILSQVNVCTLSRSNYEDHSHFFRDCAKNNSKFGDTPLPKVAMIASHDALSDGINFFSKGNPNQPENPSNNGFLNAFAKGFLVRLSKAQNDNIYEQLKGGVRMIDLRITYVDGVYYNSHGLLADTLENNLKLILKFLDENPGEFVILEIVYYYPGKSNWSNLETFMRKVQYKGKSVFDYDITLGKSYDETLKFTKLTYNNITNNGNVAGALVCTVDDGEVKSNVFNYHGGTEYYYSKWADSIDSDKVISSMNESVKYIIEQEKTDPDFRNNRLMVNQCQTAPGVDRLWGSLMSWSLLAKAHDHNRYVLDKVNIADMLDYMPIYMCDFTTCNDNNFNSDLIKLLSEHNNKL